MNAVMRRAWMRISPALAVSLAACSQAPVEIEQPATLPQQVLRGSPHAAFEQQQRERARDLTQQGHYGEAALAWEVLVLLRPDVDEYADHLQRVRARIETRVAQRLQAADEARRRGDADRAAQLYLQALSDEPLNAHAADALRALERERNKRLYLGKPSRITLARYGMADAQVPRGGASAAERNDLEHANLLMHQGEYAEAIRLLERYVKANPNDEAARKALAEALYQQAERIAAAEPKSALTLYRRAAKLDPGHALAAQRAKQLRR